MKNLIQSLMNLLIEEFPNRTIVARNNGVIIISGDNSKFRIRLRMDTYSSEATKAKFNVKDMESKDLYRNMSYTNTIELIK